MSSTLEWIGNIEDGLIAYIDSWLETENRPRPCVCWKDGQTLGFGFASHMSGDPGGFKSIGFKGYHDFYSLPKQHRNDFLKEGHKEFIRILGKDIVIAARRAFGTAKRYGTFSVKGRVSHYSKEEINNKRDEVEKQLQKLANKYKKLPKAENVVKICKVCDRKFKTENAGIKVILCNGCSDKRRKKQNEEALGF